MTRLTHIMLTALTFWLLLALMPAPQADGPHGTWVPVLSPHGEWARVTYYGPEYNDGLHYCANGQLYYDYAPIVALGPYMLEQARAVSGEEWPLIQLRFSNGHLFTVRVADTGAEELEVDLPDRTWKLVTGLNPGVGVAYARVSVFAKEVSK